MKSSTVLGIGLLAVLGVGTYIYLKSGKIPFLDKFSGELSPTSGKVNNTGSTTAPTNGTKNPRKGFLTKILGRTRPKASTPSIADTSLGLQPKATIDTVISIVSETQTENYKKAKVLSKDIEVLMVELKNAENELKSFDYKPMTTFETKARKREDIAIIKKRMSEKTSQANALGYKILPYGEIEKM
jgi:hypothetical protein